MATGPLRTVGIDVGGTKCLAVALAGGRPVDESRVATPRDKAGLLDRLAGLAAALGGSGGPAGLGIGLPGLVDRSGALHAAPNLQAAEGVEVGTALRARLGVPVVVDNDATCATWGELCMGAAGGKADVLMVTLGTGIGAGLVSSGRLVRGAHGFAGEVGHMVVNEGGRTCPCGRRGCWERYASGSGLGHLGRARAREGRAARILALAGGDPESIRGDHVGTAAGEGDADAVAVVGELGRWVALGLANLVSILDPELIVVGGGLVALGDLLLAPVRDELACLLATEGRPDPVEVRAALLGERAGAVGAAALAQEAIKGS